jgi:hypothetical protein
MARDSGSALRAVRNDGHEDILVQGYPSIVMAGFDPAIHVLLSAGKAWVRGS